MWSKLNIVGIVEFDEEGIMIFFDGVCLYALMVVADKENFLWNVVHFAGLSFVAAHLACLFTTAGLLLAAPPCPPR